MISSSELMVGVLHLRAAVADVETVGRSAREGLGDRVPRARRSVDGDAEAAERPAQRSEVGRRERDGVHGVAALDHLVADLAVAGVVDDDHGQGKAELGGGRQLLDGEHEPAVAEHRDDRSGGLGDLAPMAAGRP